jgi:hypothetical protein
MTQVDRHEAGAAGFPDDMTLVVTGVCALLGLVIGASGPIFVVVASPFLAGGPTWGGLVLLVAIAAAALSGLVGTIVLALGRRATFLGQVFLASIALTLGITVGAMLGQANEVGGWAPGPTPSPTPRWTLPPAKVTYEANGEATLTLEGVTAFVPPTLQPAGDGVYGHWCYSEPDVKAVATIEALDVGSVEGQQVRAEIRLANPPTFGWSMAIPRVWIVVANDRGLVLGNWIGQATVAKAGASSGRLTFSSLPAQSVANSLGLPATLSGQITWRCGGWQIP